MGDLGGTGHKNGEEGGEGRILAQTTRVLLPSFYYNRIEKKRTGKVGRNPTSVKEKKRPFWLRRHGAPRFSKTGGELVFCYLFGSSVSRPDSARDVDLAVFAEVNPGKRPAWLADLHGAFCDTRVLFDVRVWHEGIDFKEKRRMLMGV